MRDKSKYKHFHIYFLNKDWDTISEKAEICKMNPTAFIREMALKGEIKVYDNNQFYQLFMQLRRIGVNINQIAHLANEVRSVNATDVENLEKQFRTMKEAIGDWCKPLKYEVK